MMALTKPRLAILVSKQVDAVLYSGAKNPPAKKKLILGVIDATLEAIASKEWSSIVCNSVSLTAAVGLDTYPSQKAYDAVSLSTYLWDGDNILAFWGGGPVFQEVLEGAVRMQRKLRLYTCDCTAYTMEKIDTSSLRR
jgi:hypothetical protein